MHVQVDVATARQNRDGAEIVPHSPVLEAQRPRTRPEQTKLSAAGEQNSNSRPQEGTSWRVLLAFAGLSATTPFVIFSSPLFIISLQIVLGVGLAAATWVIVRYPTEKAKERLSSDRVQPEMHMVLGTLLPELAVNLEKLLLWTDLSLRKNGCPAFLRYPVLNLIAYITGPLWFALLMMALVFFLLVVTVISFGLILPLSMPILGLLLGYVFMVPVWVISVYILSMPPLIIATFIGCGHEIYSSIREGRERARARRMVKQRVPGTTTTSRFTLEGRRAEPPTTQHNPPKTQQWLSKMDLLKLYQARGLLEAVPATIALPQAAAQTSNTSTTNRQQQAGIDQEQQWTPAASGAAQAQTATESQ
jgi:hypothetical protein